MGTASHIGTQKYTSLSDSSSPPNKEIRPGNMFTSSPLGEFWIARGACSIPNNRFGQLELASWVQNQGWKQAVIFASSLTFSPCAGAISTIEIFYYVRTSDRYLKISGNIEVCTFVCRRYCINPEVCIKIINYAIYVLSVLFDAEETTKL